jgi:Integrase core domain
MVFSFLYLALRALLGALVRSRRGLHVKDAHASQRVWFAGCTKNPSGDWVAQQARKLGLDVAEQRIRFLIRDRDSKYGGPFDEVFRSEGIRTVKTPVRAPQASAIAERFVRTVRAECLDWLLILSRRHLERVLRVYVNHYNRERPHRALEHRAPESDEPPEESPSGDPPPRPARRPHPRVLPSRRVRRDANNGALQAPSSSLVEDEARAPDDGASP